MKEMKERTEEKYGPGLKGTLEGMKGHENGGKGDEGVGVWKWWKKKGGGEIQWESNVVKRAWERWQRNGCVKEKQRDVK